MYSECYTLELVLYSELNTHLDSAQRVAGGARGEVPWPRGAAGWGRCHVNSAPAPDGDRGICLHWDHLRTSNPIESVFATVRHRTVRTKGALSAKTAKLMVFKLVNAAAKTWRRLNGENQLPKVVRGVKFKNEIEVTEMPAHHAA